VRSGNLNPLHMVTPFTDIYGRDWKEKMESCMKVIIAGAPAAGKGTQCEKVMHLSATHLQC